MRRNFSRSKVHRLFICSFVMAGLLFATLSAYTQPIPNRMQFLPVTPEPEKPFAAQRLFKAIQLVDWNRAEQGTARNLIEGDLRTSGLEFTEFESVTPIPADPNVRLVAKLKECVNLDWWITALGKPASVNVLLLHSVETVADQELIQALVTGAEKRFGPVVAATYPIPDQNDYSLTLFGVNDCFDSIRISKNSL